MPRFRRLSLLDGADAAGGLVFVVDVLRAGTFICHALAAGASRVIAVDELGRARALKRSNPGWVLAGERGGCPLEGFDLSNSPTALLGTDLSGATVILTTSAGTQGIVRASAGAGLLAVAGFVNASAAAGLAAARPADEACIVCMGLEGREKGDEDEAFGDYLESLAAGTRPSYPDVLERVSRARASRAFLQGDRPGAPTTDYYLCTSLDRFDFVPTRVESIEGMPVLEAIRH
jgi:2-phosphosulfolactate phosphatase